MDPLGLIARDDRAEDAAVLGVVSRAGAIQASSQRDTAMSDKSPRQSMSKKSGKSLKEKRAAKRDKASGEPPAAKADPGTRK